MTVISLKEQGLRQIVEGALQHVGESLTATGVKAVVDALVLAEPDDAVQMTTLSPEKEAELDAYDAGLLNDYGGGNVEWWQDYIRAELANAYGYYAEQVPGLLSTERQAREAAEARVGQLEAQCEADSPTWEDSAKAMQEAARINMVRAEAAEKEVERLTGALAKIDAIRNSIVGFQTINWSEHIYPLVAALGEAGYEGEGYEIARENVGTLLDQIKSAEAKITALESALFAPTPAEEADLHWAGTFGVNDPDPTDDHGPIYLQCPDGLLVNFSCHATPGVDAARVRWVAAALNAAVATQVPIPMLLFCPKCGVQHVDAVERTRWDDQPWDNPPHRSHLCHSCGCSWRPADVPTEGIEAITTKGRADTWSPTRPHYAPNSQDVAGLVEGDDRPRREKFEATLERITRKAIAVTQDRIFAAMSALAEPGAENTGLTLFEGVMGHPEADLASAPALIMAAIEEVPNWGDSTALITAHCHAYVLHNDLPDRLSALRTSPISHEEG